MFRKYIAVLTAVMMLAAVSAAPASEAGTFSDFSRTEGEDERLTILNNAAESIAVSYTTEDGVTVEICQAYYEGDRMYVSYKLTGKPLYIELHEGIPEGTYAWDEERTDFAAAEKFRPVIPQRREEMKWLNGEGQRWTFDRFTSLGDGITLEDGTYADIVDGKEKYPEDGSVIGWKECRIPKESLADILTFRLTLMRFNEINFQDETTFRNWSEDLGRTYVSFRLNRNDCVRYLRGDFQAESYLAHAELAAGKVDIRGMVRLVSEKQAQGWKTWWDETTDTAGTDLILGWNLYWNGQPVFRDYDIGTLLNGDDEVIFDLQYPYLTDLGGLSLVPSYSQTGEQPDEFIPFGNAE